MEFTVFTITEVMNLSKGIWVMSRLRQSLPDIPYILSPRKGTSASFIWHVKFQINGEEHQADVHVNGIRDPKDIGKETVILLKRCMVDVFAIG